MEKASQKQENRALISPVLQQSINRDSILCPATMNLNGVKSPNITTFPLPNRQELQDRLLTTHKDDQKEAESDFDEYLTEKKVPRRKRTKKLKNNQTTPMTERRKKKIMKMVTDEHNTDIMIEEEFGCQSEIMASFGSQFQQYNPLSQQKIDIPTSVQSNQYGVLIGGGNTPHIMRNSEETAADIETETLLYSKTFPAFRLKSPNPAKISFKMFLDQFIPFVQEHLIQFSTDFEAEAYFKRGDHRPHWLWGSQKRMILQILTGLKS